MEKNDLNIQLSQLPNDITIPAEWGNIEPEKLRQAVLRGSTKIAIYSDIPISCRGDRCLYSETCYYWIRGEIKIGDRCLPEIASVINKLTFYKSNLKIADDNFIDMMLLKDLIECDLVIDRCNKILAMTDMIIEEDMAINSKGDKIQRGNINGAQLILDSTTKRRLVILKELNATPNARSKSGTGSDKIDISKVLIQLKQLKQSEGDA